MRFAITLIVSFFAASHAHADDIWLTMDYVRPYTLKYPADQIVVGNPGIADVTVQDKSRILLFGKAPGMTNIFIFDENGETVENLLIRVRATSKGMLTFHRGSARTTYNCTHACEPTVTVGDDRQAFDNISSQAEQKYNQAASASRR